jgi:hypothetical protein
MDILNDVNTVVPSGKTRDRILDIHAMDCNALDAELRDVKGSTSDDFLESMMRRYEELGCSDKSVSETKSWYGWAWKIVNAFMSKLMDLVEQLGAWKRLIALILVITSCPVIPVVGVTNPFYTASVTTFGSGFLTKLIKFTTAATKEHFTTMSMRDYETLNDYIDAVTETVTVLPGKIARDFLLQRFANTLSLVVRRLGAKSFFNVVLNQIPFTSIVIGQKGVDKISKQVARNGKLIKWNNILSQFSNVKGKITGLSETEKLRRKQARYSENLTKTGWMNRVATKARNATDHAFYNRKDRLKHQRSRVRNSAKPRRSIKNILSRGYLSGGNESFDDAIENFHREFAIRRDTIKPYMHWAASIQTHSDLLHHDVSGGGGPLVSRDVMMSSRSVGLFLENPPRNMTHSAQHMSRHW